MRTYDTQGYRAEDRRIVEDDLRRAIDANAAEIRRDARLQKLRRLSPGRRKKACRLDELYSYLERERARRERYIREHLTAESITVRRAKP